MRTACRSRALCRALLAGLAGLLFALTGAGAAVASPVSAVTLAYQRDGGKLPACEFSAATLVAALRSQAPDQAEYDESLPLAIQAALNAQDAGACAHHARAATTATTTSTSATGGAPTGPAGTPPSSITGPTSAGPPAPLLALGGAALLLALAALGLTLLRLSAWEPLWLADWRQACGEAGLRLGLTWREAGDRLAGRRAARSRKLRPRPPSPSRRG